jgi:phage host-nuclease inhibitor protein Gam
MDQITDHEAILLLRQDIRVLKDGQDRFHAEMKESMGELKNNYSKRLDAVEEQIEIFGKQISDLSLIRKLVYGTVSIILTAVVGAGIYLIVSNRAI